MLKTLCLTSALLLAAAPLAAAAKTPSLDIENFIGTINITNAPGEITVNGEAKERLIHEDGNAVLIDGGETIKSTSCKNTNGNISLKLGGWNWKKRVGGYKDLKDYPVLNITVPEDTHLDISRSVIFGDIESLGSTDLSLSSCGNLNIGHIANRLELTVSGSSDVTTDNVGEAKIKISGSGDVKIGSAGKTNVGISGSGNFASQDIDGTLKIAISGSGDADVEHIKGDLIYVSSGSPDFEAESVDGDIDITASGSSDVDIDTANASDVAIKLSGSSDVYIGGTAADVAVKASGASDVEIESATGTRDIKASSATDVTIGDKVYGG